MTRGRWRGISLVLLVVLSLLVAASASAASKPTVIHAQGFGVSKPVRGLGPSDGASPGRPIGRVNPLAGEGDAGVRATRNRGSVPVDPLAADSGAAGSRTPAPGPVFEGMSNPFACGGCTPPDTNGDVGPNNYVQVVNATKVAIYNKTGTLLTPAFELSSLFPAGPCNPDNDGDPNIEYDPIADRWVLAQFKDDGGPGPFHMCFAVSRTPDPAGAYFTYDFPTPEFPDYFKVGVWPSGYYVSTNESTYTAYALDRAKMLAGDPTATAVRFPGQSNFLMPADVDGVRDPASTDGGLFYTFKDDVFHGGGPDRIELFQLTPNFASPPGTFAMIGSFPVTPYTYTVCGFFDLSCIPQSGTAQMVDAVSEWPMQRFTYRQFGDHAALVGDFTVGGGSASADSPAGPGAAIRWFELRNTGAGWGLFQEGTYDPGGGLNRFMGSISIDVEGNIGLGYSASSSSAFPSIRYATRAPTDPAGAMGSEQVMEAGTGSQTSTFDRWGDYSAMSVDPSDQCTFWYTNEFYPVTSVNAWHTAIGNFKVPSCADADKDGVADNSDACPTVADLTTADGCPSNGFTIGKKKVNKKKGTATVTVSVPGAGELKLSGKDLKSQRPASAAKPVGAAGNFKLKVIPKGKTKKKLKQKGKAKVTAKITFTPTGGLAATQSAKVKLKRKK
ncbi:MAG: hypothetical protein QOI10_2433 [Solirubrobacterales bacterium]|jgi:hypothetical protein|nr:hypothetical protein [Solirubrobacterales bacterium]